MIFIIVLLLALALSLGYHRYMGVRAMKAEYIEVSGVTVEQIIEIGTKASTSVVKRMLGRPQASRTPEGDIQWGVQSKGGLMIFRVRALPDDRGFRIDGWAEEIRAARVWGQMNPHTVDGRARILTNWMCRALGIPQNARQLLRRRRRTLNAIARAGQVITPITREGSEQMAGVSDARP
jgi:hypothetical protein